MARTCAELITEIQALCGRTGDTVLITSARVLVWLNEAQKDIAEYVPNLHELAYKNTISLEITQTLKWPFADITFDVTYDNTTTNHIAHVFNIFLLDGNESAKLTYLPIDEFDDNWPDPTHSDTPTNQSIVWTRRGNYAEIMPLCNTNDCTKNWRIDVAKYPKDFTGTASAVSSILSDADNLLMAYGVWKSFVAMGKETADDAAIWRNEYYTLREEYKDKNDTMHEWQGGTYFPYE